MTTETAATIDARTACPACRTSAKQVAASTLRSLLREPEQVTDEGWRFCAAPGCDIVYFAEAADRSFAKSDLRVEVGVKETAGERPLCYCFGHSVESIKAELAETGESTALEDIRAKMKDPGCHCEMANPSGACCLGSVTRGIEIARGELGIAEDGPPPSAPDRGRAIASVGAVLSAIVASSCCWLPLVLLAVGVSGAGMAAMLEAYRPLFAVLTVGFLGVAFYLVYRPRPAKADDDCCAPVATAGPDCCAAGRPSGASNLNKGLLWVVTVLAVGFLAFPNYVGALLGSSGGSVTAEMNQATFAVEGMTCEGCEATVATAVRTVPGIAAVDVDYTSKRAVVGTEDETPVPIAAIVTAMKSAGYEASVVSDGDLPHEADTPTTSDRPPAEPNTVALDGPWSTWTGQVTGMTCPACGTALAEDLAKVKGVGSAQVDYAAKRAVVRFDPTVVKPSSLAEAVEEHGFEVDSTTE